MKYFFKQQTDILAIIALFITSAIFYSPIVLEGKILGDATTIHRYYPWRQLDSTFDETFYSNAQSDSATHFYPWKESIHAAWRAGKFPFWDRCSFAGQPHLFNPYSGIFYPFNYLTYLIDYKIFYSLWFFIERLLFTVFIYLSARVLLLRTSSAFISAIVGSFGTIMPEHFLPWDFNSIVWFGPCFFLIAQSLTTTNYRWLLGVPICIGLACLGGHLEYVLFLSFAMILFRVLYQYYNDAGRKKILFSSIPMGLAIIGGALLAAISLLPYLSLGSMSQRGISFSTAPSANISPAWIISLIAPGLTFDCFFIGFFSIPPLIFAIHQRRSPLEKASFTCLLTLIGIGLFIPLFAPIVRRLPLFSNMRGFQRIAITFPLFLGLLVGEGFNSLFNNEGQRKTWPDKFIGHTTIILSCVILLALSRGAALLATHLLPVNIQALVSPFARVFSQLAHHPITDSRLANILQQEIGTPTVPTLLGHIFLPVVSAATLLLILQKHKNTAIPKSFSYLFLFAIPFELVTIAKPAMMYMKRNSLFPPTRSIETLQKLQQTSTPPFRSIGLWDDNCGIVAPFRFLQNFGIEQAGGYASVYSKYYREYVNARKHPNNAESLLEDYEHSVNFQQYDPFLLRYAAVKYIATAPKCAPPGKNISLVYAGSDLKIYEARIVLPRIYLVKNSLYVPDKKATLALMLREDFNPRETVIINEARNPSYAENMIHNSDDTSLIASSVVVNQYNNDELNVTVRSPYSKGYLVLLDNYMPGWHCFINNQPREISRVFQTFMAISVPQGISTIDLRYTPPGLLPGKIISGATLIVILIMTLILFFYPASPEIKQ